ncbi:hypothetical protein TCA2_4457 [Paenibacillus sp. TCA20]|uniref:ThiF family adenylyltransferase n=1 Tax=Paenibacillus urinalis TaxID=521520 RepID=A0ABY7XHC0_9BACL|nr:MULTISPECIES: ThiF family adenylyltransferase [Paenibacillus]WDI05206.1 ThiF family adenylyltransferase [Paenibacillus urinalis]GAK41965.1 hypothetical protein TCA2_4457 [Paenibacillus sp. TCA20]
MIKEINVADSLSGFSIVQIGVGGNGGYLTQRLSKMLKSFLQTNPVFRFTYTLIDGDRFEEKNLLRQPCIEEDIGFVKSQVLADRYGNVYDFPIHYKDEYIESIQSIEEAFSIGGHRVKILIGCVDNHATRKIMHEYFHSCTGDIIYIDSGIDPYDEDDPASGYSGQIVCGLKLSGKVVLQPVGDLYEDILTDTESKLPTESCGDIVANQPQRMMTNEMAALVMAGYLNNILGSRTLISHVTNFNARLLSTRSEYITAGQFALAENVRLVTA